MTHVRRAAASAVAAVMMTLPDAALAQTIGSFRWQLEPYCNVITLTVVQNGGVYELEGTDDQCGANRAASASGTAFLNPDGSIGVGLAVVTAPSGIPVHVEASIALSTLSGTWHDSAGATGTFRFTPGPGTGGAPRPATGSIGAALVNAGQVQLRINGGCAAGTFMQSVGQPGSVVCGPEAGDIADVSAGPGLTGGGVSGSVVLALPRTGNGAFLFDNGSGFVAPGGTGAIPVEGPGNRTMWVANKAAFRSGSVSGTAWDQANIGTYSVAFGRDTRATGYGSFAAGENSAATNGTSVALGSEAIASGPGAIAMGVGVTAGGFASVVLGLRGVALPEASGTFIFSDRSTNAFFTGYAPNEFLVRSSGGASFYTNPTLTSGVRVAPGSSAWSSVSDVAMKENFRDLDPDDVLAKIARMPIREWNYKTQDAAVRHVGPTAQDFYAAFGLGEDPLRISTIDADGVALAAVQALDVRTRAIRDGQSALSLENQALHAEIAELRRSLDEAKKALAALMQLPSARYSRTP